MSQIESPFLATPYELFAHIVSFTGPKDQINMSKVSKQCRKNMKELWGSENRIALNNFLENRISSINFLRYISRQQKAQIPFEATQEYPIVKCQPYPARKFTTLQLSPVHISSKPTVGSKDPVANYHAQRLKTIELFRLESAPQLVIARMTVLSLLDEAKLEANSLILACGSTIEYQEPKLISLPFFDGTQQLLQIYLFKPDFFSSFTVGCDPTGAKIILQNLDTNERDLLLDSLKNDCENLNQRCQVLFELINTMASQALLRHGPELFDTQEPQTMHQLLSNTFIRMARYFKEHGLLSLNHFMGGKSVQSFLCTAVIFELLKNATLIGDELYVSSNIVMQVGHIHAYCQEQPIMIPFPNALTNNLNLFSQEVSSDLKLIDLLVTKQLIEQLSTEDLDLLEKYIHLSYFKSVDSKLANEIKTQFPNLNEDTQKIFQLISKEIAQVHHHIVSHYSNSLTQIMQALLN